MSSTQSLLYFIFFLSGATGLVYQVVWVRLTGLVFGNTSHAIATVLGAFMAGLALGSWKLGQAADRTRNPLRMYGLLEIGIGISAALTPLAFQALDSVYWLLAPSLESIPGGNSLARFVTSFLLLIVPTFLMGGTLPMLTRFFTHRLSEVERKVGILYALNTFGAAAGTLLAALYFIPVLGNTRSTFIIAALNIAIGVFSIWYSRLHPRAEDDTPQVEMRDPVVVRQSEASDAASDRLVLLTLAISGFAAMIYEVAWTRALTAIIGSSTYAFSIMLVTFLVGIALGSSIVSRWRPTANLRLLGLMQLGIAIGAVIFLVGYLIAPYVLIGVIRALFYSFHAILTTQFFVSAALMIFATLFMGATFPIASQLYSNKFVVLGRSIGNVYSINTVGAIAGSLLAGFLLIPTIGTERTILIGLFLSSAIALRLLLDGGCRIAKWTAFGLLMVATVSMGGGFFWAPDHLDRGILIYARQFDARPDLTIGEHYQDTDVVFFREGNNATISVRRGENYIALRTNGKVDASNRDDMKTQLMFGYLPVFYHPAPASALIIGYGSGVTVGAAAAFEELDEIDCVEIEPAVVAAAPWFSEINRMSYADPRVRMIYDDARSYMNVTRKQYDVIISEPSNPWIAGVANLFTAEFYDRAVEVLKPDGVFAQWVQLYELDPEDLRMILSEFHRKFAEVSIWHSGASDLILIGTHGPQQLDLSRVSRISQGDPEIMRDFRDYLNMSDPEGILAYYVASTDAVRQFAQTSRRNTDDHPVLEFHAPRRLFSDTTTLNLELLYDLKDGLIPPDAKIPDLEKAYGAMIEPFLALGRSNFADEIVGMLAGIERKEDASLHLAIARIHLDDGDVRRAEEALLRAGETVRPGNARFAETEELWGVLHDRAGSSSDAILHFERAISADPGRALPLRRLAELYASSQSWDEAATWMERFLETKPVSPGHFWAMLGDYRFSAGKPDEGFDALETALEIDPYTFWAHYRMARFLEDRNEVEGAIQQYEFIMHYGYDRDAEVYVNLARLYSNAGRLDQAVKVLEKGMRIFPANIAIYRLLRGIRELG